MWTLPPELLLVDINSLSKWGLPRRMRPTEGEGTLPINRVNFMNIQWRSEIYLPLFMILPDCGGICCNTESFWSPNIRLYHWHHLKSLLCLALIYCFPLGCFWHLDFGDWQHEGEWIWVDAKVKKPRRRPPPVSAAARGALAAACERLYSVGSRCLEAWTGSRVKSSQCNCRAMQPYQTRSDTQLTWLPFRPKCNGYLF